MRNYLSLIKFSHTVFALPFALVGFVLGIHYPGVEFDPVVLILIILCMIFARSAAMAFNRFVDRHIDAVNARTSQREIPAGVISPGAALTFTLISSGLFILCTYFINPLCFALSPVALAVVLGYSYTKRFTAFSHFILGLGLALAPIGAFLAVTEVFDVIPVLIGIVVLLWVGGFDIIYALQDESFDTEHKLHSIPTFLGAKGALVMSSVVHLMCGAVCIYAVYRMGNDYEALSWLLWGGAGMFLASLAYQHTLVKPGDLSKVNLAFFTTNGLASIIFGTAVILDFYI
ncbi:MAG: 4-hydroxybenzoate octaprenyltransferase [Bacteroidetes bacterium]|nr:MAG: 4-hydroxybenzoate octaprenyltransferase [Bacteroidota bacterium]